MPFEVTASQKDQTLPMILTLRGDETIVEDFNYDTDQAMAFLGIKRSRLNQISGRELRVARIRRDRYIRPVYRECDLKDYLEWTRATATHLSSSKAIEQAVENLDDRFNDVLQVFNDKLQQVSQEQQGWMKGEFEKLPLRVRAGAVKEEVEPTLPLMQSDKVLRQTADRILILKEHLIQLEHTVKELSERVNFFIPEMKELNVGQKALRFDFDQRFESLSSLIVYFRKLMVETISAQNEQVEKIWERVSREPPASPLEEAEPSPTIRQKRKPQTQRISRRFYSV